MNWFSDLTAVAKKVAQDPAAKQIAHIGKSAVGDYAGKQILAQISKTPICSFKMEIGGVERDLQVRLNKNMDIRILGDKELYKNFKNDISHRRVTASNVTYTLKSFQKLAEHDPKIAESLEKYQPIANAIKSILKDHIVSVNIAGRDIAFKVMIDEKAIFQGRIDHAIRFKAKSADAAFIQKNIEALSNKKSKTFTMDKFKQAAMNDQNIQLAMNLLLNMLTKALGEITPQ